MAVSSPASAIVGTSELASRNETVSSSFSATSLSRTSSNSSDLLSVSSSTSVGQAEINQTGGLLSTIRQSSHYTHPKSHFHIEMTPFTGADDETDIANRRISGRARKLTARGQALVGSKYIPVASANNASNETVGHVDTSVSDESVVKPEVKRRSSTPTTNIAPHADINPHPLPTTHDAAKATDTFELAEVPISDVLEQSEKRELRRDRKPSARLLEATTGAPVIGTVEGPNRRASRCERIPTAKAVELKATPSPRKRSSSASEPSPAAQPEEPLVQEHPLSPLVITLPLSTHSKPRRKLSTPSKSNSQSETTSTPSKRSAPPSKNGPRAKSPRLLAKVASPSTKINSSEPDLPLEQAQKDNSKVTPLRISLKPLRRPSNLRFELPIANDDNVIPQHYTVATNGFETSSAESPSEAKGIRVDGKLFRPTKLVIARKPEPSSSVKKPDLISKKRISIQKKPVSVSEERKLNLDSKLTESTFKQPESKLQHPMADATPIRFSPFVPVTPQATTGCNLFCLSPSSRILAFAQIAAESTDSDEEDDKIDAAAGTSKSTSKGLYEKWIAIGRERFCVCNKPGYSHAHPASTPTTELQKALMPNGVSESSLIDPALPTLAPGKTLPLTLPPLNSVMPAAHGRKVSALYSAMADAPRESRQPRPSHDSNSLSLHPTTARAMSFEERMSEDYKALEAIRQQANMEGVPIAHDMTYGQIKARLDEHRVKASHGFVRAVGLGKGNSGAIQI